MIFDRRILDVVSAKQHADARIVRNFVERKFKFKGLNLAREMEFRIFSLGKPSYPD